MGAGDQPNWFMALSLESLTSPWAPGLGMAGTPGVSVAPVGQEDRHGQSWGEQAGAEAPPG